MTEYGFEIKLKVVQDYLDGKGGYRFSELSVIKYFLIWLIFT
ncbi:hypothetical protein [Enterococcus avium]